MKHSLGQPRVSSGMRVCEQAPGTDQYINSAERAIQSGLRVSSLAYESFRPGLFVTAPARACFNVVIKNNEGGGEERAEQKIDCRSGDIRAQH